MTGSFIAEHRGKVAVLELVESFTAADRIVVEPSAHDEQHRVCPDARHRVR